MAWTKTQELMETLKNNDNALQDNSIIYNFDENFRKKTIIPIRVFLK